MLRKTTLLVLLATVALLAAGAPATGPSTAEAADATVDMPPAFPLPHCGEFCFTPGQSRGCIDSSSGTWRRVQCTCSNGAWACY